MIESFNDTMPRSVTIVVIAPESSQSCANICFILSCSTTNWIFAKRISIRFIFRIKVNVTKLNNVQSLVCSPVRDLSGRTTVNLDGPFKLTAGRRTVFTLQYNSTKVSWRDALLVINYVENYRLKTNRMTYFLFSFAKIWLNIWSKVPFDEYRDW